MLVIQNLSLIYDFVWRLIYLILGLFPGKKMILVKTVLTPIISINVTKDHWDGLIAPKLITTAIDFDIALYQSRTMTYTVLAL